MEWNFIRNSVVLNKKIQRNNILVCLIVKNIILVFFHRVWIIIDSKYFLLLKNYYLIGL